MSFDAFTSSLLTYSLSRTSTTFDFFFSSSLIIGYKSLLQSMNVNVNKNVVKFLMINVCGLVKRIQYPEFMELIEGYDILCFIETKTDDFSSLIIGYKSLLRSSISGGNCSPTPKCVPFQSLPEFLFLLVCRNKRAKIVKGY
jgi:hypothetical protein